MSDPLPCPICGSSDVDFIDRYGLLDPKKMVATKLICQDCGTSGSVQRITVFSDKAVKKAKINAVEHWNTRKAASVALDTVKLRHRITELMLSIEQVRRLCAVKDSDLGSVYPGQLACDVEDLGVITDKLKKEYPGIFDRKLTTEEM